MFRVFILLIAVVMSLSSAQIVSAKDLFKDDSVNVSDNATNEFNDISSSSSIQPSNIRYFNILIDNGEEIGELYLNNSNQFSVVLNNWRLKLNTANDSYFLPIDSQLILANDNVLIDINYDLNNQLEISKITEYELYNPAGLLVDSTNNKYFTETTVETNNQIINEPKTTEETKSTKKTTTTKPKTTATKKSTDKAPKTTKKTTTQPKTKDTKTKSSANSQKSPKDSTNQSQEIVSQNNQSSGKTVFRVISLCFILAGIIYCIYEYRFEISRFLKRGRTSELL